MLAENRANTTLDRVLTAKFDETIDRARGRFQISEQIDNRWGQVNSRVFVPMVYLVTGDFDAAWRISSQGLALRRTRSAILFMPSVAPGSRSFWLLLATIRRLPSHRWPMRRPCIFSHSVP